MRLAGPILRRVTPKEVHVWIVLAQPNPVRVRIMEPVTRPPNMKAAGDLLGQVVSDNSLAIGASFYVHLVRVQARGGRSFPPGHAIPYDVEVQAAKNTWTSVVKNDEAICYKGSQYPAFTLPGRDGANLRILYGSCRKLHAPGHDPLVAAVDAIEESSASARPHLLLLTGDQIYADEMARLLAPTVQSLAQTLGGGKEPPLSTRSGVVPALGKPRGRFARKKLGFSTGEGENHLLAFWEYAAAYLLAFSPATWPSIQALKEEAVAATLRDANSAADYSFRHDGVLRAHPAEVMASKAANDKALAALEVSRTATIALSKLLANTSTFMVFDDHEVTDDWNLSGAWVGRVETSEFGNRVVANALAAHWVFQGFGNAPDRKDCPSAVEVAKLLADHLAGHKGAAEPYEYLFRKQMRWHYEFHDSAPLFCLDTRTQRVESDVKRIRSDDDKEVEVSSSLELVDSTQLDALGKWLEGLDASVCPIIVSAVPVFTFSFLESLQQWLSSKGEWLAELLDNEGWRSNPGSFFRFAQALQRFKGNALVLISGDLHFGYVREATLVFGPKQFKLVQFTASAIRNEAPKAVRLVLEYNRDHPPLEGERTWWKPKDGVIGLLSSKAKPEQVAEFTKAFGEAAFKESSCAIDLRRPEGNAGGVAAGAAALFPNHLAWLELGRRHLSNRFILNSESRERLAPFHWSW